MKTENEIKERIENLKEQYKNQELANKKGIISDKEMFRRFDVIKAYIEELDWVLQDNSEGEKKMFIKIENYYNKENTTLILDINRIIKVEKLEYYELEDWKIEYTEDENYYCLKMNEGETEEYLLNQQQYEKLCCTLEEMGQIR